MVTSAIRCLYQDVQEGRGRSSRIKVDDMCYLQPKVPDVDGGRKARLIMDWDTKLGSLETTLEKYNILDSTSTI